VDILTRHGNITIQRDQSQTSEGNIDIQNDWSHTGEGFLAIQMRLIFKTGHGSFAIK